MDYGIGAPSWTAQGGLQLPLQGDQEPPQTPTLDTLLGPSQPLCWEFIAMEVRDQLIGGLLALG